MVKCDHAGKNACREGGNLKYSGFIAKTAFSILLVAKSLLLIQNGNHAIFEKRLCQGGVFFLESRRSFSISIMDGGEVGNQALCLFAGKCELLRHFLDGSPKARLFRELHGA